MNHHAKKVLEGIGRAVLPPGAAGATFWAVDSNWASIAAFIYQFVPAKWGHWFIDNVAALPGWIAALIAALVVLSAAVYFRNWQLGERLSPKFRLEFDPTSPAQIREEMLTDGTPGIYVRVLPICETMAQIDDCKGHLNGVYQRKTEYEKWKPTKLVLAFNGV
jgi:hypothetical protein